MLVKTGDAQIISVIDKETLSDDNKRNEVLSEALKKAKEYTPIAEVSDNKDNKTESQC
jgi:hypothetical protein